MVGDERARLVVFVVEQPAAGAEENLPLPGPNRSRLPWLLLVPAAAVLLVWALLSASANRAHAPAPSAARTPPIGAPARPVLIAPQPDPRWCPDAGDGQTTCSSTSHVPAPVLVAVRSRFPRLDHLSFLEEQLRDVGFGPGGLWYREVRGRQLSRTITVEVYRPAGSVHAGSIQHGSTLTVTHLVRGLVVRVRATGGIAALDVLVALADDPRLRARGPIGSALSGR